MIVNGDHVLGALVLIGQVLDQLLPSAEELDALLQHPRTRQRSLHLPAAAISVGVHRQECPAEGITRQVGYVQVDPLGRHLVHFPVGGWL